MITLEQVKTLETKVSKAIDLVKTLSEENVSLKAQAEAEKKRAAALEQHNLRLRSEIDRIGEGILAALDKLNKLDDAVERSSRVKSLSPAGEREGSLMEAAEKAIRADAPAAAAPAEPAPREAAPQEAAFEEVALQEAELQEAELQEAEEESFSALEAPDEGEPLWTEEDSGEEPEESGGELDIF